MNANASNSYIFNLNKLIQGKDQTSNINLSSIKLLFMIYDPTPIPLTSQPANKQPKL